MYNYIAMEVKKKTIIVRGERKTVLLPKMQKVCEKYSPDWRQS